MNFCIKISCFLLQLTLWEQNYKAITKEKNFCSRATKQYGATVHQKPCIPLILD